jgi:hypothetical protein
LAIRQAGLLGLLVLISEFLAQTLECTVANGTPEGCLAMGFKLANNKACHVIGEAMKQGVIRRGNGTPIKGLSGCWIPLFLGNLDQSTGNSQKLVKGSAHNCGAGVRKFTTLTELGATDQARWRSSRT